VAEAVAGFVAAAERVGAEALRAGRHRLEHLEMVDAEQRRTLAALGVTASVQPLFDRWWGGPGGVYETRLGERSKGMNPFAALLEAGVPLAFGSDSPVTPLDPWAAVRAAVNHHDPAQRIDVGAAVEAHTRGGWRAARRDEGGTLEPGAAAYLAVWDAGDDALRTVADSDEPLPACALTMVAGDVAYDGGGLLS
jgi:predicted amidohydrolase YtcJ